MLGAALEGVGLAQVPEPITPAAVKAGKLVNVLEKFEPMAPGMFLLYCPGHSQMMPKLLPFIDYVKAASKRARRGRASQNSALFLSIAPLEKVVVELSGIFGRNLRTAVLLREKFAKFLGVRWGGS